MIPMEPAWPAGDAVYDVRADFDAGADITRDGRVDEDDLHVVSSAFIYEPDD